jgi:hypothetical protein
MKGVPGVNAVLDTTFGDLAFLSLLLLALLGGCCWPFLRASVENVFCRIAAQWTGYEFNKTEHGKQSTTHAADVMRAAPHAARPHLPCPHCRIYGHLQDI